MPNGELPDFADFASWYESARPRLIAALVLSHGGPEERVTEAVDEACVRACERWQRVRRMASPTGWTYVVARNLLFQRRKAQLGARPARAAISAPDTGVVEIIELLSRLPARQAQIVVLRCVLDLSEANVAQSLGLSRGAVSASLAAARHRLTSELLEEQ